VAEIADDAAPDDPGERGTLTVRGRAAGRIVERAALEVPGVVRHTTRRPAAITGRELPRAVVDMTPERPNVRVDIALVWPSPVADLCRRVRERVVADLDRFTGRVPSRVDIEVAELVVPRPDADQPRSDPR
jgi:uncharacterized alkaline shock family protein YloU